MKKNTKTKLLIALITLLTAMVICFAGCDCKNKEQKYKLNIVPAEVTLVEGESFTFSVDTDLNGAVAWSSSDYRIFNVAVDTGEVRAQNPGTAFIYATVDNKIASATVIVVPAEDTNKEIELNVNVPGVSLYAGQSVKVDANLTENQNALPVVVSFTVDNQSVATVSNDGVITAVANGTATVTASAEYNGQTYVKKIAVTVRENVVVTLSQVNVNLISLTNGSPTTYEFGCDVVVNGQKVEDAEIAWSSQTDVVSIDDNGVITVLKTGSGVIYAEYVRDQISYKVPANVNVDYFKQNVTLNEYYVAFNDQAGDSAQIKLPSEVDVTDIKAVYNINKQSLDFEPNVTDNAVVIPKTAYTMGASTYTMRDTFIEYSFGAYAADWVIDSKEDYEVMMNIGTGNVKETVVGTGVITADIDFGGASYVYATNEASRTLTLDGNNHVLSNVVTNGLFSNVVGGHIKNVIILNPTIVTLNRDADNMLMGNGPFGTQADRGGAFANSISTAAIVENIAVVNAKVGVNTKPVGMFAGRIYSSDTTIKNCLVVDTSLSKQAGLSAWFENIGGSAAKALFINNYAITANNYAACDTVSATISSGYADYKVVSTYSDMLSEVGSNVKVFTCLEFDGDDVLIAGVKINENMQFTDIVADFEKGVENTLTSTIIANETVNKVTISDAEVAFTQDGDTLTFSATALAKAPISDGLEMLIYTDAKTYICKANVSIDAPVMNTKLKEVPVICVGDMVDNAFTVDLPLETSTITQIGGCNSWAIVDNNTVKITLNDLNARGEVLFDVYTADTIKAFAVYMVDYAISTTEQLEKYLSERNFDNDKDVYDGSVKYAALTNNVELSVTLDPMDNNPYGRNGDDDAFYDVFDGRGHAISGVDGGYIETVGIFSIMQVGSVVRNLSVVNPLIAPRNTVTPAGAITSVMSGGTIENVIIANPIFTSPSNSAPAYAGAVAGKVYNEKTVIKDVVVFDTAKNSSLSAKYKAEKTASGYVTYNESAENGYFRGLYGAICNSGLQSNVYENLYVITENNYKMAIQDESGVAHNDVDLIPNAKLASYDAFKTATGSKFDEFISIDEFGSILTSGKVVIAKAGGKIAEEIAIGKQATVTVDAVANTTVTAITIAGKSVEFTQNGNKITFSADTTATLDSGIDLEMIITADIKYKASVTVYNEIASKEDYEKMMVGVTTGTGTSAIRAIDGYYVQTANINLGDKTYYYPYLSNAAGTAISVQFRGVYDGKGYTITGGKTSGIFGCVTGTIKNVVLVNTQISAVSGADRGGAVCNTLQSGGVLDNVYVIGATVIATCDRAEAFLVGQTYTANTTIKNCLVVDTGSSKTDNVTALIGHYGDGVLTNTYAITANGYNAVWSVQANVSKYDSCIATDYNAFTTACGQNISEFKLLTTESNGNVTVGGIVVYTAQA